MVLCIKETRCTGKKSRFLRFFKVPGTIFITTVSKENLEKKGANDHGEFQTQSPQRLKDGYKHTSSRNDRWRMRLKLIQEEYYSIGNQKS